MSRLQSGKERRIELSCRKAHLSPDEALADRGPFQDTVARFRQSVEAVRHHKRIYGEGLDGYIKILIELYKTKQMTSLCCDVRNGRRWR